MSPYQPPDDGKPPASYTAAINLLLLPKPANRPPPFTRLRRPHVAWQCGPAAADMISGEEFAAGAQQLAAHWARCLPGEPPWRWQASRQPFAAAAVSLGSGGGNLRNVAH
jgi:hypothetical protein